MGRALFIDPNRLFAAADALLRAMKSREGLNSLVARCVDSPAPESSDPALGFTRVELTEAYSMLVRMGFSGPSGKPA